MFIEERHQGILETIARYGKITNGEIQEKYKVSYDSAKRDLRILEEKGLLTRTHGGAIKVQSTNVVEELMTPQNQYMDVKLLEYTENELSIAKYAIGLIDDMDVIYLSASKIGKAFATVLPKDLNCIIVTNSLEIASILQTHSKVNVVLAGGSINSMGECTDIFARDMLKRFRFNKAFITSGALSQEFGASDLNKENIGLLDTITGSSKKVIGLYTGMQLGEESVYQVLPMNKIDLIITDWYAKEQELKKFDMNQVNFVIADR